MITTYYDSQENILFAIYKGIITSEDVIENLKSLLTNADTSKDLIYFEDMTEATFSFKPTEMRKIAKVLSDNISAYRRVTVAILHSKPRETAYSFLALQLIHDRNFNVKIFTTREAAMNWLSAESARLKCISN